VIIVPQPPTTFVCERKREERGDLTKRKCLETLVLVKRRRAKSDLECERKSGEKEKSSRTTLEFRTNWWNSKA
jgi:hypothetical protein